MSAYINSLIKAIANCIGENYPYEIYIDEIKQGFIEPCFFIEVINSRKSRINNNRYKMTTSISVHYFPEETEEKTENISVMIDDLYKILEVMEGKDRKYRALDMGHTVSDYVLHFNFTVIYHVEEVEEIPLMEELELKGGLKFE